MFDFPPEEPQREIINAHARNSGEGARTFAPSGDGDRPDQNGQQDGQRTDIGQHDGAYAGTPASGVATATILSCASARPHAWRALQVPQALREVILT